VASTAHGAHFLPWRAVGPFVRGTVAACGRRFAVRAAVAAPEGAGRALVALGRGRWPFFVGVLGVVVPAAGGGAVVVLRVVGEDATRVLPSMRRRLWRVLGGVVLLVLLVVPDWLPVVVVPALLALVAILVDTGFESSTILPHVFLRPLALFQDVLPVSLLVLVQFLPRHFPRREFVCCGVLFPLGDLLLCLVLYLLFDLPLYLLFYLPLYLLFYLPLYLLVYLVLYLLVYLLFYLLFYLLVGHPPCLLVDPPLESFSLCLEMWF
jgi:hypothetical protein